MSDRERDDNEDDSNDIYKSTSKHKGKGKKTNEKSRITRIAEKGAYKSI